MGLFLVRTDKSFKVKKEVQNPATVTSHLFTATKLKEACYMLVDTPEQLTILENQSEMFRSVLEHTNVIESTCAIKYLFHKKT